MPFSECAKNYNSLAKVIIYMKICLMFHSLVTRKNKRCVSPTSKKL